MNTPRNGIAIAALALAVAGALALAGPARAEVFAEARLSRVATDAARESALFRVDSLWRFDGARRVAVKRFLNVSCPPDGDETLPWEYRIRTGDTLAFVQRRLGGVLLEVPERGWPARCRCAGKRPRPVALFGFFANGRELSRVARVRDGSMWRRVLTLNAAGRAKAPDTLRVLLSWEAVPPDPADATPGRSTGRSR